MSSTLPHELIIIGSGPAGLTAGIYGARANLSPLIIEGKNPGGQLMSTTVVENWPGEKSIMGPQLMMDMKDHAKLVGCSFLSEEVIEVNFKQHPFILITNKKKILTTKSAIIATGATPKRLQCKGEDIYWGKGVSTCAVCDGAFYRNVPIVIVGGGDTAMEEASFMSNFTNDITIIHIGEKLTASAAMQERVLKNPNIKIIYNSTVTEIVGDNSRVTQVVITQQKTKTQHVVSTAAVFVAIGLNPNTALFKDQLELTSYGYIKLKNHTHTSISGIFAAGDVADARYRQAITSSGTGCMAALDAERYIKSL